MLRLLRACTTTLYGTPADALGAEPAALRIDARYSFKQLDRIVEKCLEEDLTLRYQSAADLQRLRRDLETGKIAVTEMRKDKRRRHVAAWILGAAAILACSWINEPLN
jgi:hypothetical protein